MRYDDFTWKTSSYSVNSDGRCVEVGWRKSSHSRNAGGDCVEAGPLHTAPPRFAVRDSTQRELGFLTFGAVEWRAFVTGIKAGEFPG